MERLSIKAKMFWCYLRRLEDEELLKSTLTQKLGFLPEEGPMSLVEKTKEYLARGVIQNQTELIFRDQGMMEEVSTGLHEVLSEYHILMQPVMIVLQEEYMKLVTNISMLEESLTSFDYDSILFRT
jgi:hypothetical protein